MTLTRLLLLVLLSALPALAATTPPSASIVEVSDIAALRALNPASINRTYNVRSGPAMGTWVFDTSSTATDNTGTVTKASSTLTGRFLRQYSGPVNVTWFGADTNGLVDSAPAFQSAVNLGANKILAPQGYYLLNSTISMRPRTELIGDAPEHGNLLAYTNTSLIFNHTNDGVKLATGYPDGAAISIRGFRMTRAAGMDSTNALVNLSNVKGGSVRDVYMINRGVGSKGIVLSNSFQNVISGFTISGYIEASTIGVAFYYPCTVNEVRNGNLYYQAVGIYSECQNNLFTMVNREYGGIGFQAGTSPVTNPGGNADGTVFVGGHSEANTVADYDMRNQPELSLILVGDYTVQNGGGVEFLTATSRDIQNVTTLGRRSPDVPSTGYQWGKLGPWLFRATSGAGGVLLDLDTVNGNATSYNAFNLWKTNTASGARALNFYEATDGTPFMQWHVTTDNGGSMVMSNRTHGGWFTAKGTDGGRVQFGLSGAGETRLGLNQAPAFSIHVKQTNAAIALQSLSTAGENIGFYLYNSADTRIAGLNMDMDTGLLTLGPNGATNALSMTYGAGSVMTINRPFRLNGEYGGYRSLYFVDDAGSDVGWMRQDDATGDIEIGTDVVDDAVHIDYGTGDVTFAGNGTFNGPGVSEFPAGLYSDFLNVTNNSIFQAQCSIQTLSVGASASFTAISGPTAVYVDAASDLQPIANASGVLTNNGTGTLGWYSGLTTIITNLVPGIVTNRLTYTSGLLTGSEEIAW